MKDAVWTVNVTSGGKRSSFRAADGSCLLDVLLGQNALPPFPCGGKGTCGKCRVRVAQGLPLPTAEDRRALTPRELAQGWRLACRITVRGTMQVELPGGDAALEIVTDVDAPAAVTGTHAPEASGSGTPGSGAAPRPMVTKTYFAPDNLPKSGSDLASLAGALDEPELTAGLPLLRALPGVLRTQMHGFTAVAHGKTLLALEKGDTAGQQYGICVDIGTTTVACYLVELTDGHVAEVEADLNAQAPCGMDVISRIAYTQDHARGLETLHARIVGQLNTMMARLCARVSLSPRDVWQVSIAGNTVMLHFLLGLPADHIAAAPFTPVTLAAQEFPAEALGLCTRGAVYVLPGIASYVGADITAGLLACGAADASSSCSLLLDLGTNGEMALFGGGEVTACAVAAGPAFEGGNLSCGCASVRGAVDHVSFQNGGLHVSTVGGAPISGICGSGVLDAVALLRRTAVLDETGRLQAPGDIAEPALRARLRDAEDRSFLLVPGTSGVQTVQLTQKDIREFQLAKAAVAAGIQTLLQKTGRSAGDVERVYLAGGFGSRLLPESAAQAGLIPSEWASRAEAAGNTSGEGARLCLLSPDSRRRAEELARRAQYVELSTDPDFQKRFVDAMTFS